MITAKASLHRGRASPSSVIHNSRQFNLESPNADHIDAERSKNNVYKKYYEEDSVLEYYKNRYLKGLMITNERHAKSRNYKRIKSLEEFYNSQPPHEDILQWGHAGLDVKMDLNDFVDVMDEYVDYVNNVAPDNIHVLCYWVHTDEQSIHCHMLTTIDFYDTKDDCVRIGIDEGLKCAGIDVDNREKLERDLAKEEENFRDKSAKLKKSHDDKGLKDLKKSHRNAIKTIKRYNNRTITFTRMLRERFEDILEAHGYPVDRNRRKYIKHLTKKEYEEYLRTREERAIQAEQQYTQYLKEEQDLVKRISGTIYTQLYERAKEEAQKEVNIIKDKELEETNKQLLEAKKNQDLLIKTINHNENLKNNIYFG